MPEAPSRPPVPKPAPVNLSESPVMKRVATERQQARKQEDEKFAQRTRHKRETFTTANQVLDEGAQKMRGDLDLDGRRAEIERMQTEIAGLSGDAKIAKQADLDKKLSSYNKDFAFIESTAVASTLDKPEKATKAGTQKKVVALLGYRAHLQQQLDILASTAGTTNQEYDRRNAAMTTEIARINALALQMDEMIRVDVRTRGKIGRGIRGGLRKVTGQNVHGLNEPIMGDTLPKTSFWQDLTRQKYNTPDQHPMTVLTAEAFDKAAATANIEGNEVKNTSQIRALVNNTLRTEREAIYRTENQELPENRKTASAETATTTTSETPEQIAEKARKEAERLKYIADNGAKAYRELSGLNIDFSKNEDEIIAKINEGRTEGKWESNDETKRYIQAGREVSSRMGESVQEMQTVATDAKIANPNLTDEQINQAQAQAAAEEPDKNKRSNKLLLILLALAGVGGGAVTPPEESTT